MEMSNVVHGIGVAGPMRAAFAAAMNEPIGTPTFPLALTVPVPASPADPAGAAGSRSAANIGGGPGIV